jgi:tRNA (guanine-N7-)-methyltransferase
MTEQESLQSVAPSDEANPPIIPPVPVRPRKPHPLFIEWETVAPVVDFRDYFGNERPVEIEVGSGKALFLRNAAVARPDHNFFGIEIVRKYAYHGADRLAKKGLTNVRVLPADALAFLKRVPDAAVDTMHLYFPDPWWKKRHHKRRVFRHEFVADVARVLVDDGKFLIVTDVADYFELVQETMREFPEFCPADAPETHDPQHDMDYLTNFERKFRIEGRPIYRVGYRRVARNPAKA